MCIGGIRVLEGCVCVRYLEGIVKYLERNRIYIVVYLNIL